MKKLFRYIVFGVVAFSIVGAEYASAQPPPPALAGVDSTQDKNRFGQLFIPYGVRPERAVAFTPDGVSFQLGSKRDPGHVGVRAKGALAGDFSIELRYELTTLPGVVDDGYGASLGIGVNVDYKVGGASIARGVYKSDGSQYSAGRTIPRSKGMHYATAHFPTTAKSGRLALRRVGGEILLLAADSPTGEFLELERYPFPTQSVQDISIYADTGGAIGEFKGRIFDLKITSGAAASQAPAKPGPAGKIIVPLPDPEPATSPQLVGDVSEIPMSPSTTPVRGSWWIPVLTFVVGIIVGVGIRRSRQEAPSPDMNRDIPKPKKPPGN